MNPIGGRSKIMLEFLNIQQKFSLSPKGLLFVSQITFESVTRTVFSEFLKLLEERVRLMPFADQRLTLDLTGVKALNSKALSSLHELFHRVGTNNGIRLKYLFDKTNKEHVRYAHNLEKISADLPTDSAIVCLVTSHSESEEQFAPKSKKRRNNR